MPAQRMPSASMCGYAAVCHSVDHQWDDYECIEEMQCQPLFAGNYKLKWIRDKTPIILNKKTELTKSQKYNKNTDKKNDSLDVDINIYKRQKWR